MRIYREALVHRVRKIFFKLKDVAALHSTNKLHKQTRSVCVGFFAFFFLIYHFEIFAENAVTYLWVGTTFGTVVVYTVNSVSNEASGVFENDEKNSDYSQKQTVSLTLTNMKYSLKGQILCIAFLDPLSNLLNFSNSNSSNNNSISPSAADSNAFSKAYSVEETKVKTSKRMCCHCCFISKVKNLMCFRSE
jgi:hypothetical protein